MEIKVKEVKEAAKVSKDKKLTGSLLWIVIISCFGSVQYGYNLWTVYSPSVLIQGFYYLKEEGLDVSSLMEPQNTLLMTAFSISLFPVGATAGSLLVGPLVDKSGRKGTLVLNSVFSMTASLLMACGNVFHSFRFTMLSRFLIGLAMGIYSTTVPLYLIELSPVDSRGIVGMAPQLFLALGVLVAQILAFEEIVGTNEGWPALNSLSGILALFQSVLMLSFPESPRYLLIQKKDEEQAREALMELRCLNDVEDEIEELHQEDISEVEEKDMNALKLLGYKGLRWQALSIIILMCSQQLSGVNAVYYYTERTYLSTGIESGNVRYISVASTIVIISAILFGMYIVESTGRKILLLVGFVICSLLCVVLTVTIELKHTASWIPYINSVLLNVFLVLQAIGPSSLSNLMIAELFLQSSRSSAYVVGGFVHWIVHFFTVMVNLQIQLYVGAYNFLAYFPITVATSFYIYKMIPETKGRTFLEIWKLAPVYVGKRVVFKVQPDQLNGGEGGVESV